MAQPRERGAGEAVRARTSLTMIGLACLIACLAIMAPAFQRATGAVAHFVADPAFVRLAGAALAILAGAFLAAASAAETRLAALRERPADPPEPVPVPIPSAGKEVGWLRRAAAGPRGDCRRRLPDAGPRRGAAKGTCLNVKAKAVS